MGAWENLPFGSSKGDKKLPTKLPTALTVSDEDRGKTAEKRGGRTWARTKDPLIKSHDQRVLARPHVSKNGGILGFRVRIVLEMFASIHYKKLPKVAGTYGEQSRFDGR